MPLTRRNSLPQGGPPATIHDINLALKRAAAPTTPSQSLSATDNMQNLSNIMSQAKEVGEMTRALHVRQLERQVHDLEAHIEKVCQRTEEDQTYREKNEARLAELFHEVVAVKTQAAQIQGQPIISPEELVKMTETLVAEFKAEMDEQRKIVREAQELSAQLRSPDEILALLDQKETLLNPNSRRSDQNQSQESSSTQPEIEPEIERRIKEAISSTVRWNIQHKNTQLEDPLFIKNYLEKQASRDMQMAQFIQRSLARLRAQRGLARSSSQSLAEFCTDLTWEDVKDVIRKIFGNQRVETARKLAKGMK